MIQCALSYQSLQSLFNYKPFVESNHTLFVICKSHISKISGTFTELETCTLLLSWQCCDIAYY